MSEAQKILEMIEAVDPDDTDTLDEIDARAWCFVANTPYHKYFTKGGDGKIWVKCTKGSPSDINFQYTRSRDVLKAIRPNGWCLGINNASTGNDAMCELTFIKNWIEKDEYGRSESRQTEHTVSSPHLPTEELAELHAIIQSIEWERNNE